MKHKQMKRILSMICAVSLLLALGACAPAETVLGWFGGKWVDDKPYENYKMSKFIKLGTYKGVEGEFISLDGYLEMYIENIFSQYGAYPGIADDAAKTVISMGDLVFFNYEGTAPGISEETKKGMKGKALLLIGSGNFIPGFEEQMVDQPRGVEFTVDVTFPEGYGGEGSPQSELNGKAAVFKCTVHKIGAASEEFTDEGVDALTNGDYTTLAAFEEMLRADMAADLPKMTIDYNTNLAFDKAFGDAQILKLPPKEQKYWDTQLAELAAGQGASAEEFALQNGYESAAEYRDEQVAREVFIYAVAQAENLTVSEEDVQALVADIRAEGYEGSDAELYSQFGGKGYLLRHLTRVKVMEFLFENAKGMPKIPDAPVLEAPDAPDAPVEQ